MKHKILPITVAFFSILLLVPSVAHAQRGARLSGPMFAVSARRSSTMVGSAPVRTSRRSTFSTANRTAATSIGLTNIYPGAGLGINGINAITTQNNLGVEAAIDPATRLNLALAQRVLRESGGIFSGGYYLLSGGGAYVIPAESTEGEQQPVQQQPQVIVVQQAPVQQPALQSGQPPVDALSLPDAGQFTLVLHDGKRIDVVAFTYGKDKIVYIASDGSRRTIGVGDLDTSETMRVNEERGTPLQLHL